MGESTPVAPPVRLIASDDLKRSRWTVGFRAVLALPLVLWLGLWSYAIAAIVVANWFATLFTGRSPTEIHDFLGRYVRFTVHVSAYLFLGANSYPGFLGVRGSYPIDVEFDPSARQNRWKTGFRLILAVPALLLGGTLAGGSISVTTGGGLYSSFSSLVFSGSVLTVVALLAWFACLARARMPQGFSQLVAFAVYYSAQVSAYLLLMTDRYPNSDPCAVELPNGPPEPPRAVRLTRQDDGRRSRLTVFFRLLLALPHIVWLTLWSIVALFAGLANGVATLIRRAPPAGLHRFLAAYVRYQTHVAAYLYLIANPFPGFTGRPGSYPLDLVIEAPGEQGRWGVFFRPVLAIPAFLLASSLSGVLGVIALLGWFASLATGRMSRGLTRLGAYALGYSAQMTAYSLVLTARYPYSGPVGAVEEPPPAEAPGLA